MQSYYKFARYENCPFWLERKGMLCCTANSENVLNYVKRWFPKQ